MKKTILSLVAVLIFTLSKTALYGQPAIDLTMEQAIDLAQSQSIESMATRNSFLANYWAFRSFRSSRLPSLNFTAEIASFDRSQRALQNYQTGEIVYTGNYNMYNVGTLSVNQNIFATGGTLSLYSSFSRLDQWKPSREITYYTQPVTLYYLQPLWTYNSFKWDKKIEPEKYEKAKREYLENMENITLKAVSLFYKLLLAKMNYDLALTNYSNTSQMYSIANQRFIIGKITKSDVLQLELRMINDSLSINNMENTYQTSLMSLKSFLGLNQHSEINLIFPDVVPDITLDPDEVLEKAFMNSSFMTQQRILELEAGSAVAKARGDRGISAAISTQFGLSNNSDRFKNAYRGLLDREIIGLTLNVPIIDWGMNRGREKIAKARMETTLNEIEQALVDYQQEIYTQVIRFNSQARQCRLAQKAMYIADERYVITLANFTNGTVNVTELNTAQSEKEEALKNYIMELSNYWESYFDLRRTSLYDFRTQTDISAQYDKLIEQ